MAGTEVAEGYSLRPADALDLARITRRAVTQTLTLIGNTIKTQPGYIRSQIGPDEAWLVIAAAAVNRDLDKATVLTVSPAMTDLVMAAAPTFPIGALSPPDIPWPAAFVVLGRGVRVGEPPAPLKSGSADLQASDPDPPIKALGWTSDFVMPDGRSGMALVGYATSPVSPHPPYALLYDIAPFGTILTGVNRHDDVTRFLLCLWTMVQQRIAVPAIVRPDRPAARRWVRAVGTEPPQIIEITLRRPPDASPAGSSPVDWSHQWIVGGHWRQHYMPASGTHRPTWIAPYVKGPDDKPLVVRDKVYAWKR